MNNKMINEKVREAREFFNMEKSPGDFFDHLKRNNDFYHKYKLIIFKQDLIKLSGFIGYSNDGMPLICVNNKRPLGHQNFTLAHEIGHMFLHKGICFNDTIDEITGFTKEKLEKQAHRFASEFIYPNELVISDSREIEKEKWIEDRRYDLLGEYINKLCIKYCTSFSFTLKKLLYELRHDDVSKLSRSITRKLGKLSDRYDDYMYNVNCGHEVYEPYLPTTLLKSIIDDRVENKKISYETGNAIWLRNQG